MGSHQRTLYRMHPMTRKVARLVVEMSSATRRLKQMLKEIERAEAGMGLWVASQQRQEVARDVQRRDEGEGQPLGG